MPIRSSAKRLSLTGNFSGGEEIRKISGPAVFLGIFFLLVGISWMSVIGVRCRKQMPEKEKKTGYAQIYERHYDRVTTLLSPLPVKRYMPKAYIIHFWTIVYWEFLCALLYALGGLFLLRAYSIACHFAFFALTADMALKALIASYQYFIILPLREVFQKSNIMFTYFMPDRSLTSEISFYLTGIKLAQPGALWYGLIYAVIIVFCYAAVFKLKKN